MRLLLRHELNKLKVYDVDSPPSVMATLTTGQKLNDDGTPIPGTGFEYESDGHVAELLEQRIGPIVSQPITGEWLIPLVDGKENNGEFGRAIVIFAPGNLGPPEHFHPNYVETFEIISGDFVFMVNGKEKRAGPGDKLTVEKGVRHGWRCVGEEYGVVIGEAWPQARIAEVVSTLFGMAHEGKLTKKGQPKFLHAMLIGREYSDDTVFTSPPPFISSFLTMVFAPLARLLGYKATEPRYLENSFWEKHVNQP